MEENKMLEKLWREAETVDIPPELEPEQIRARIEAQQANACRSPCVPPWRRDLEDHSIFLHTGRWRINACRLL